MPKDKAGITAIGIGAIIGITGLYILTREKAAAIPEVPEEPVMPPEIPIPEEPPVGLATLVGTVIDTDNRYPVKGVKVTLNGLVRHTNDIGRYEFKDVAPGDYIIELTKADYEPVVRDIFLVEGLNREDVGLTFTLEVNINPHIKLSGAIVAPQTGYVGEEFFASITAQGAFEEPISGDILLEWDGNSQVKNTGGLRWDEKTNVTFTIVPQASGTYRVKLNNVFVGSFKAIPVPVEPVGPAPGWIEWNYGPRQTRWELGYRDYKLGFIVYSKGWLEHRSVCVNGWGSLDERTLELRGIDTTGCYGNRQACVGRTGVRTTFGPAPGVPQRITTTVTGVKAEGYCISWVREYWGLNNPEARQWYESVLPIGVPLLTTGQTSYSHLKDVLRQIESSGGGDVTNLVLSHDEASSWWMKLTLFDVSQFLNAVTRLKSISVYILK